jgi:hypothetical protein
VCFLSLVHTQDDFAHIAQALRESLAEAAEKVG